MEINIVKKVLEENFSENLYVSFVFETSQKLDDALLDARNKGYEAYVKTSNLGFELIITGLRKNILS